MDRAMVAFFIRRRDDPETPLSRDKSYTNFNLCIELPFPLLDSYHKMFFGARVVTLAE